MNPFDLVGDQAQTQQVPCVLIGAFAMHFHGVNRQTMDVDFLVSKESFRKIFPGLTGSGYLPVMETDFFSRWKNDEPPRLDVDFLFVDPETMAAIVQEAKTVQIRGRPFLVPSLNHLIALKLHAIEQDPRTQELKDLADIVRLVQANRLEVHSKEFKTLCLKFSSPRIYDKILDYAGR